MTGPVELWAASANIKGRSAQLAADAVERGFDGISFGDTQCQNPDAFIGLVVAAAATERLRLAIGVTNPVTRHPAVLACSIATVQLESGGRTVLGIGRGDSAVEKIGRRAATATELDTYLARLQAYLRGETVEEDGPLAKLAWLAELKVDKVPVDVAASGPKVMAVGGRRAERVTLNVGADPARIEAAVEMVMTAAERAGNRVSLGAYLNVAAHPDPAVARDLVKPVTAVYARFSRGGMSGDDGRVVDAVAENYDMSRHGRAAAAHLAYLEDGFVERFALAGTPEECIARLRELHRLGIDRFCIVGPTPDAPKEQFDESWRLLRDEVFPALKAGQIR